MNRFHTEINANVSNSKPLIPREQSYVLDRKVLTVHSEDRDITKWPNSNTFEIVLPEAYLNVESIRLIQCTMPSVFYTFTNDYQNTKLTFTVNGTPYTITIEEGYYTPCQMALELTNLMNQAVTDASFNVFYDEVAHKFWFGSVSTPFTLNFDQQITYTLKCPQPLMWNYYANWGLPYYLGFNKESYVATNAPSGVGFDWVCPTSTSPVLTGGSNITYYVKAPMAFTLDGDTCIYMEVDKQNSMDEMYPYNQSTKAMFNNNAYDSKVNAAFAKIPIKPNDTRNLDAKTLFLLNYVHYEPPLERLARLKFKFRFHDGRLVDFQNFPYDFAIELNMLRDEILKSYTVRVPHLMQI